MEIAQEEVFGPVMVVMKFGTDAEALDIVNSCNYGLGSNVFTLDRVRCPPPVETRNNRFWRAFQVPRRLFLPATRDEQGQSIPVCFSVACGAFSDVPVRP